MTRPLAPAPRTAAEPNAAVVLLESARADLAREAVALRRECERLRDLVAEGEARIADIEGRQLHELGAAIHRLQGERP